VKVHVSALELTEVMIAHCRNMEDIFGDAQRRKAGVEGVIEHG
jgi:hypothetical protein